MDIDELDLDFQFKEILKTHGIESLFPPQADAIRSGLLEGKNHVVAIPTASGKTLIAILAIVNRLLKYRGKAVYLAPLRALASEKYDEIREFVTPLGLSVGIATGDLDSEKEWVGNKDIIIATNEKFDSFIRQRKFWLNDIDIIISDEIHVINDNKRGPVLEVVLSQIKQKLPTCQIIALSATISNSSELAEWLGAELITSEWRPVSLKEGIWESGTIYFDDRTKTDEGRPSSRTPYVDLAINGVNQGGQSLVFCNTRNSVIQTAKKIAEKYSKSLNEVERENLEGLKKLVLATGEKTKLSQDLADLISQGVAFHHAGLHNKHRKIIEKAFKQRKIKILTASPTLCLDGSTEIMVGLNSTRLDSTGTKTTTFSVHDNRIDCESGVNVLRNYNDQYMLSISTKDGRTLTGTGNHKIMVQRGLRRQLIPLKDVKESDLLISALKLPFKQTINRFSELTSRKNLSKSTGFIDLSLDNELGFLFAIFYLCEMPYDFNGCLVISVKNLPTLNKYSKEVENLSQKFKKSILEVKRSNEELTFILHGWLAKFVIDTQIKEGLFPSKFHQAPPAFLVSFTRYFLQSGNPLEYSIKVRNHKLAKNLRNLFLLFGIVLSVSKNTITFKESISTVLSKIQLSSLTDKGELGQIPILNISETQIQEMVYDVQVRTPENNFLFLANGFVVHNSAGVNTPSRRVIIRSLHRYTSGFGNQYIPVLEYKQMAGRAGRPKYDDYGESILLAKNEMEKDELMNRYVTAETEMIFSKLGSEPSLRMHLLSFIVSGDVFDFDSALDMISTTFYGYQNSDQLFFIEETVERTFNVLTEAKLISSTEPYTPTPFGRKVNELYLDPLSAQIIKEGLQQVGNKYLSDIVYFHLLTTTPNVRTFYVREKEMEEVIGLVEEWSNKIITPESLDSEIRWDFLLQEMKTAQVLIEWINETSESDLLERYNVTSGDLYNIINTMEWLLRSSEEISKLFKLNKHAERLKKLNKRLKYGISEELISLTEIHLIGRKRARILYNMGIKSVKDFITHPRPSLAKALGPKNLEAILRTLDNTSISDDNVEELIEEDFDLEEDTEINQKGLEFFFG